MGLFYTAPEPTRGSDEAEDAGVLNSVNYTVSVSLVQIRPLRHITVNLIHTLPLRTAAVNIDTISITADKYSSG